MKLRNIRPGESVQHMGPVSLSDEAAAKFTPKVSHEWVVRIRKDYYREHPEVIPEQIGYGLDPSRLPLLGVNANHPLGDRTQVDEILNPTPLSLEETRRLPFTDSFLNLDDLRQDPNADLLIETAIFAGNGTHNTIRSLLKADKEGMEGAGIIAENLFRMEEAALEKELNLDSVALNGKTHELIDYMRRRKEDF